MSANLGMIYPVAMNDEYQDGFFDGQLDIQPLYHASKAYSAGYEAGQRVRNMHMLDGNSK